METIITTKTTIKTTIITTVTTRIFEVKVLVGYLLGWTQLGSSSPGLGLLS